MENKLYRDENAKVVGGVCAGLADYFNVDVSLVRVAFVFAMVVLGTGGMLYIILWIVLPKKDYFANPLVDYTVPPQPGNLMFVKKKPSSAAIIGGTILILLGAYCLLDQFDLIPYFELHRFWPVIFIIIGLVLIFNPDKRKHFESAPWDKKQDPEVNSPAPETKETNTDNPEII
ncbi:PspC domain-containing protein [Mucilaginibacter sp. AW1-3]